MATNNKRTHVAGRRVHVEAFRSGAGAHDQTSRKKRGVQKAKLNHLPDEELYDDEAYSEW
jgi:hypothetical protein